MNSSPDLAQRRNRPASTRAISAAEKALEVSLPLTLVRRYERFDGIPAGALGHLPFRLMPLDEVVELNRAVRNGTSISAVLRKYGVVLVYADDQSNHAGVFSAGPLYGRVGLWDHEGYFLGDISPVFFNVASFERRVVELAERNALVAQYEEEAISREVLEREIASFPYPYYESTATAGWHAIPLDYPVRLESSPIDRETHAFFRAQLQASAFDVEDERSFLVNTVARLCPQDEVASLHPFLREDDMFIPRPIAWNLFIRRDASALPELARLAVHGHYNCRESGVHALAAFAVTGGERMADTVRAAYATVSGDSSPLDNAIARLNEYPELLYQW